MSRYDCGLPVCRSSSIRCLLQARPARFLKVKELVESGAIGEVRFVTVALYQRPRQKSSTQELALASRARNRGRGAVCGRGLSHIGLFGLCARSDSVGARICVEPGKTLSSRGCCDRNLGVQSGVTRHWDGGALPAFKTLTWPRLWETKARFPSLALGTSQSRWTNARRHRAVFPD